MGIRALAVFLLASGALSLHAQVPDSGRFSQPVALDSFVVSEGFDVGAFIARVRADTTFYKAFKSMRMVPYRAENDIEVFGRRRDVSASLRNRTRQTIAGNCRRTNASDEQVTGDFYKRDGDYRYYTAKLFAYLFFADTPQCNETDIVAGALEYRGEGQMEKSKYELKQLMFNPGGRVSGVPFMGSHASIFDMPEAAKYEFKIVRDTLDGIACLVFRITPKKGYERDVIYNEMVTWFRKTDYSILRRDYSLSYHTMVYDFDVKMSVKMRQAGKKLYPVFIAYDGNWHVLTKKRERVKFTVKATYGDE